jgi:hypothetical protein
MSKHGAKAANPPSDIEQVIQALPKLPHFRPLPDSAWWEDFKRDLQRVFDGFEKSDGNKPLPQLARQIQFQDDVPTHVQDVAAFRAAKEIVAVKYEGITSCKELAQLQNPLPSLMSHARQRWKEYRDARSKARHHFAKIVWPWPTNLDKILSPAEAYYLQTNVGDEWITESCRRLAEKLTENDRRLLANPQSMVEFLAGDFLKLPDADQEAFLRRTHRRPIFQSFYQHARRYAAGLIDETELRLIMLQIFPQFSLDEKILFVRLLKTKPRQDNRNRLAVLATWLQDNAPVFSEFRWHTVAVLLAAAGMFNDHDKRWIPESPESLTQFCSRATPRIKLGLHRARYADETARFAQPHRCLLTDPPLAIR